MRLQCLHCGTDFAPGSQFCTSCGQSLLGEHPPGSAEPVCAIHPDRAGPYVCERCGVFACAECLRAGVEGATVCASCHTRVPAVALPWDRREELGLLTAYWKTCIEVMLRPGSTFDHGKPEGSLGSSLLFVALSNVVAFFTTLLLYALIFLVMPMPNPSGESSGQSLGAARGIIVGTMLVWMMLMPLFGMVMALINAGIDHLVLKFAGITRGFSVTLRANALSYGPYLLGLVPLCSMYVAPFWVLAMRVFAYKGLHRIGWGRAALGALTLPVLSCLLCGGFYAAIFFYALSQAGR